MTHASLLFHNTNAQVKNTLYRKITPTDEQYDEQRVRWNDVRDYLKETLKEETGLEVSSWLQGSYKFGTQIRPTRTEEEFDIDLGIYFAVDKKPTEEKYSPKNLKKMIQRHLKAYAVGYADEVLEVVEPAKERCSRIRFPGNFHIDIPCYYEISSTEEMELATESNGWEDSDPVAFHKWFQNSFNDSERALARRIIQYIKCWSGITFKGEKSDGQPSSVLITVLVTQALTALPATVFDLYDDEVLTAVIYRILERLQELQEVNNPVNASECLSDRVENFDIFLSELKIFKRIVTEAMNSDTSINAALKWEEAFQHFFPIPEEEVVKTTSNSLLPYKFEPVISVFATSKNNSAANYSGVNKIGPIPKNCSITFQISNASKIPDGCMVQWTVRNNGSDSEYVNDLGHRAGNDITIVRNSAYTGTHYMDCLITFRNQIIAFKRVPVEVSGFLMPRRNPLRPAWTSLRKRN